MNGSLIVVDDVAAEFAERVIEAFHSRPADGFSIALSGGDTARQCYERLADDAGTQIDWWKVDVYWGDERCVPPGDDDSNERLVREALLDRVGAANAVYPMRCDEGPDAYQLRLGELGRLDPGQRDRAVEVGLRADFFLREFALPLPGLFESSRQVRVTFAGRSCVSHRLGDTGFTQTL